jgi:hypothetical protein
MFHKPTKDDGYLRAMGAARKAAVTNLQESPSKINSSK